jgi:hypothetical protein
VWRRQAGDGGELGSWRVGRHRRPTPVVERSASSFDACRSPAPPPETVYTPAFAAAPAAPYVVIRRPDEALTRIQTRPPFKNGSISGASGSSHYASCAPLLIERASAFPKLYFGIAPSSRRLCPHRDIRSRQEAAAELIKELLPRWMEALRSSGAKSRKGAIAFYPDFLLHIIPAPYRHRATCGPRLIHRHDS